MQTPATPKGEWGDTRLRHILTLFRFQNLALARRYGGRPGWTGAQQDMAFAQLEQLDADSFKKARLFLKKSLRD